MARLRSILTCCLLIAGIATSVYVCLCLYTLSTTFEAIPKLLHAEAEATRADARAAIADLADRTQSEIATTRRVALGELRAIRADTTATINHTATILDARVSSIEQTMDARLESVQNSAVSTINGQLDGIRADIRPTVTAVNQASALLLKPNALPAQTLGLLAASKVTMGQVALTMREVRKASPDLAASSVGIAKSVDRIADRVARKGPWWERALKASLLTGRILDLFD